MQCSSKSPTAVNEIDSFSVVVVVVVVVVVFRSLVRSFARRPPFFSISKRDLFKKNDEKEGQRGPTIFPFVGLARHFLFHFLF